MKPGYIIYEHAGKQCLFKDIPSLAEIVLLGVVQDDGSIKNHRENLGIKK